MPCISPPVLWQSGILSCICAMLTQCCMFHQPRLQNVSHIAAPLRGFVCCRASSLTQPRAFSGSLGNSGRDKRPPLHPAHFMWRGDSHLTTHSIQVLNCYHSIKSILWICEDNEDSLPAFDIFIKDICTIFTICYDLRPLAVLLLLYLNFVQSWQA